ncbi:hypothetical protein INT45_013069 [Circinella minor]|uniref:Uncharacterized protein n=1 Tax=Circinella minor TaxID=1195481 RepID=A0A8H7VJW2_9FUNG|nr:hypothetical protein INT45_013069 [Circinella minor]
MATNAALNLISNIYDTIDKEKLPAQQPSAPIDNTAASADDEINTHPITHKKLSDKLSNGDLVAATTKLDHPRDGSPKSDLLCLSSKLLQKQKLSVLEESALELSLSGIYNYLNPAIVELYKKELNHPLPQLPNHADNTIKVPKKNISEVFEKNPKSEDINNTFYCRKSNRRDTELLRKCGDEHEPTFYGIMDVLSKGPDIILSDGETACQSPRIAIEANKCVFAGEDTSPTYSRKIDLLLKYGGKKAIDLCSNEWEKSKVTNDLKIKQQSKNMRANASIINNLQGTYGGSHSVLALDVIADNYFIATSFRTIIIPRCFPGFNHFEGVLQPTPGFCTPEIS